jgi:cytochrome P450
LFFNPLDIWDPDRINSAVSELSAYFGALADQRREDPQPDLVTALVEAEDDGTHLTREELIANVGLLAGAGFDTTAGAFGNFMLALYHHPHQRRLVMEQPDLWPNAIEELLRYDGPGALNQRFTTAAVDVGGRTIPAHSAVSLLPQAGNRDPRRYDNPAELRLDRESPKPLSFGHGIHYCLGAHLARLELRVGMNAFLDHFGEYTIDESSIEWRRTLAVRGPLKMIVTPGR